MRLHCRVDAGEKEATEGEPRVAVSCTATAAKLCAKGVPETREMATKFHFAYMRIRMMKSQRTPARCG